MNNESTSTVQTEWLYPLLCPPEGDRGGQNILIAKLNHA